MVESPADELEPLSAIRIWRFALTRSDSQGSSIAFVVSEVVRTGCVGSVMSNTGTPGVVRLAVGVPVE